jgi:hypothetical protein
MAGGAPSATAIFVGLLVLGWISWLVALGGLSALQYECDNGSETDTFYGEVRARVSV